MSSTEIDAQLQTELEVEMTCEACVADVTGALAGVEGVTDVQIELADKVCSFSSSHFVCCAGSPASACLLFC